MKELRHFCLFLAVLICSLQYSAGIDAPDDVAVSNNGSTDSLKVKWTPPVNATGQEVRWSPADGNGTSYIISGTRTEFTITALTPGTPYNVTVTVYNGTDDDSTSVPKEGRTRPSPVSNLMELGATNESISASWTKPGGVVDQYLVSCSDDNADPSSPVMDDGTTTTYTASCEGLSTAGAEYTITVTSQSGGEVSDPSTIPITALPSQVTDLGELGATNDSISANWTKPLGVVTNYIVICPSGPNQTIPEDDDGSTKKVTCEGLPYPGPGGDHTITVITMSGDKASAPATVTITAYPNSVFLRAGEITTRQITVLWDDPDGVEDSFIVDCASNGTTDTILYPGDASNGIFEATCDVPKAGALFGITVISRSGERRSSVTETFTAATPAQVAIVTMSSDTTSITVGWNALSSADGFNVSCSEGDPPLSSTLPGSATEATCNGVTAGGNHSVSIVTLENNGRSSATVTYVVAVPERVTLTEESDMVTTTMITASWSNATGVFDYYEVSCSNGTASPDRVNPTDELIASCTGLTIPGDDYNISVTTISSGQRSETDTITITALPDAVTLAEGSSNNTAISATWTISGVVDSFTIICSNGTAFPSSIPVASSPTSDTFIAYCTGLPAPGLEYFLSVVAFSNNKPGAIRTVGVHASPFGVDLEPGSSTTDSVSATWMNPVGAVEHYEIRCSSGEASPYNITDTTQPSYSASCVNLPTSGDTYIMTVYSFVENGMTSSSASINLTALPAMVTDLMELTATNDSVSANWTKPAGVVTNYIVICPGGPNQTIPEDNNNSTKEVICEGLPEPGPGGNHTITVITVSGDKASAPATITITAYPNSVVLREGAITTRQITVLWDDPDGIEESFIVDCAADGSNDITLYPGDATGNTFQATCNVTMAGAPYDITVISVSGEKRSSANNTFTAATPIEVTIVDTSSNTTSVSVSWNALSSADGFNVSCSDGDPSPPSLLPGSATRATCEGVTSGGNHSVTVITLENNGRSPATVTYVAAVPGAVNLTEESANVTTSSITASWSNAAGVFDYYEVSCSNGTASPARVNPSDDLIASCTGLPTPGDDYDISVTTVSNGLYSETDTIRITALPEAVELVESGSNTDFISASWRVPSSVVDTFNVTCSAGTASRSSIPVDSSQAGELLNASCIDLPRSGEEYTLSVVAISKEKQSAVSEIQIYALPLGVVLEEGPSTLTSVSARWMRQNDTVESYRITCDKGDPSPPTIEDTTLEFYSASCVNLREPGGTYKMTVFSEVGTNTSSNSTTASSFRHIYLVAVPESVEGVSVANYTTTTVDVEWQLKNCSGCVYNYFNLTFEPDSQDPITVYYTNGVTQYSSPVSGLTQGRSYNFTVVSVSGVGVEGATSKTSEEQSVEQRTVPATPHGLNISPTQTTLSLNWSYVGVADDFIITVMPSHGTAVFNGDLTNPAGEVSGLTPGTEYNVSVVTISGDERSEPQTEGTRTETDKPSQVQNPVADPVDKNTITLTYESPASPNGIIVSYIISYIGTRDNLQDHEFTSDYGRNLTVNFDKLYPGYSYIFTIIAVNDGGFESDPVSTEPVTTEEEVPLPVAEDYPYKNNTVVPYTSTTGFTVELPRDLFSHDNGELINFSVIITTIANDADVQSTERTYSDRSQGAYITIFRMPYPYPPSYESSRRRRATEPNVLVVIGDGTCSDSSPEYCNGALNDGTEYHYAFRAYNSRGSSTSGTFGPVYTVKDNTTGIAVGVSMSLFAIIFVIAVGAFVTMRRRKRNTCNSQRPSLEGNENRGFIPPGDDQEMRKMKRKPGSSMYRKSHSKPVLLTNFEDHYRRMKADSDFKFTEEYDEIRQVGKGQPIVAALEMVNRAKNRFTNILPYEHSRVKLAALADEPDTDYINANYMPGYGGPREFIACQGPLPGTVDDMWRMIWEKNTSIVVMLTQLVEMGKIKCHQYWPENYNPVTYGTIEVTMQAVQQFDHWVIREFTIVKGDDIRKLTQYHFMSWPDHGVPNQTSFMLDFVRTVREAILKVNSENPTVVHCSAGVGRTGTYIALDRLMQMMQEHDFVDIFGIICEMRMQRNLMVQTEKQYIFIHECVMDLLRREDGDTGESIYVNFNANGYNGDVSKNLLDQAV